MAISTIRPEQCLVLIEAGMITTICTTWLIDCPKAIHIDNRMQNWGTGMIARDGVIDQRLKTVRYQEPPYSAQYPNLIDYWDTNPAYPSNNVIEGNLFYQIGDVVDGRTEWGEFHNNWTTNQDPGFVNPDDPLQGFKPDAPLFKYISGFPKLPFDKIGCKLPQEENNKNVNQ